MQTTREPDDDRPVLGVLVATTRPARVGRQLGDEIATLARRHSRADVRVVDLKEVALPFLDEPRMPSDGDYQHEHTRRWAALVTGLDAIVVVTAQYNGGYPAPLKNALDTIYAEWRDKPILVVTYGGLNSGGGRSSGEQLRVVLRRLRTNVVEPGVAIPLASTEYGPDQHLIDPAAVVAGHRAELESALDGLLMAASQP